MAATTFTTASGRKLHSTLLRPFAVVERGSARTARHFGSIETARKAAPAGSRIFLDYAEGCGHFIEAR